MVTFETPVLSVPHQVCAEKGECPFCWPRWPKPCACGGMVHAEFSSEGPGKEALLKKACDTCEQPRPT